MRIYGNDTFALVLAQKLNLHLVSPDDDLLVRLPAEQIGRRIRIANLGDACNFTFPTFVKSVVPKQFRAGVYASWPQLESECAGLSMNTPIYESEVVKFDAEVRGFIFEGRVQDAAVYEGSADSSTAMEFLSIVARNDALPVTCVLDIGFVRDRGWVVVEANAAWGAGLNGCDPDKVLGCIAHATQVSARWPTMARVNLIVEKSERVRYYTDIAETLAAMNVRAEDYDWYVSDMDTNFPASDLGNDDRWVTGQELARVLRAENSQFTWGVFSAVLPGQRPAITVRPCADGNPDFWNGTDIVPQLPEALFEIVCWDGSATLLIGLSVEQGIAYCTAHPEAAPLESYRVGGK